MKTLQIDNLQGRLKRALSVAVALAEEGDHPVRHGAVMLSGNKLYGGVNQTRPAGWTHLDRRKISRHPRPYTMHAEISCMHGVDRDVIRNSEIIVIRLGSAGELRLSRPCSTCEYEMSRKGVRRVFFSLSPTELGVIEL